MNTHPEPCWPHTITLGAPPGHDHKSQAETCPRQRQLVWPTTLPPLQAGRMLLQLARASRMGAASEEGAARVPVVARKRAMRPAVGMENCILLVW